MLPLPTLTEDVRLRGLNPIWESCSARLLRYFQRKGIRFLVLHAVEPDRGEVFNAHALGRALDLNVKGIRSVLTFCHGLIHELNGLDLPGTFYAVWEGDHLHLEWSPPNETPRILNYQKKQYVYDGTRQGFSDAE